MCWVLIADVFDFRFAAIYNNNSQTGYSIFNKVDFNSINNNLSTFGNVTTLMNNVTYLNNDIISLSGRIQNYYYSKLFFNYKLFIINDGIVSKKLKEDL